MRIKITLAADRDGCIDFNYQHQIQALIYEFLSNSDPDYAAWLHDQGYVFADDKIFKLFVFSGITFHKPFKAAGGFRFKATAADHFIFSFQIASPLDRFLQHLVQGIFKQGQKLRLSGQDVGVERVETLPSSGLDDLKDSVGLRLRPLESPIFVKKPMPRDQRDVYLFPGDEGYEDFLNQNLFHKYETLYGKTYEGGPLKFEFQPPEGKSVKAFKVYKNGQVVGEIKGTLRPFTAKGPKELIRIGLECGFGQNNSLGCGYVEVV